MATPIEEYEGVLVKREDLYHPGYPSGKLRALIPYMKQLKTNGYDKVVVPLGVRSRTLPAVSFVGNQLEMEVHVFLNSTENIPNPLIDEAKKVGNPIIHYERNKRHAIIRVAAKNWAHTTDRAVLLPSDAPDKGFYRHYSAAVCELPKEPLLHVIPFLSGSWIRGLFFGLKAMQRVQDSVVAVPIHPDPEMNNMLARALQEAVPQGHHVKNTLPDNVVISTEKPTPTPWPSDSACTHRAWSVAKAYVGRTQYPVLLWSMGQGHENRYLRS